MLSIEKEIEFASFVPVIDDYGRIAATALREIDLSEAWNQLENFPMPLDDEDIRDHDVVNPEKSSDGGLSSAGEANYSVRQMMQLIENNANKQVLVRKDDWSMWCTRLEVQQLALEQRPNNSVVYRIADVQERIEEAEHQLAKVNRQLLDLEKQELTTQEIEEAFIDFDRIWEALTMREQSQLLALLVSRVEFDQSDCTIAITFHSSGIESLEQQAEEV